MADDSKKIRIMRELVILLEGITHDNEFHSDVKKVYTEIIPIDELKDYPCIVLDEGTEHYKNADGGGHTAGLFEKVQKIFINCFLYNPNDMQEACKKIQADVEYVLFRDRVGTTLNGTCQEIMLVNADPFGTIVEKPNGGITLELDVHYRQNIKDPTK